MLDIFDKFTQQSRWLIWGMLVVYSVLCTLLTLDTLYKNTALKLELAAREEAAITARLKAEEQYNEKLSQATNEMVGQLRRITELAGVRGADLERLRGDNARLQARLKASTGADSKALARCSELLAEGAELASEGEGLLLRNGAEHDALTSTLSE